MERLIRIGTRESELAVWQATLVKNLLSQHGYTSQLVYIKSEGDTDLKTPLYELGVQGIFTKTLDIAMLNNKIDIAVHSMKDVPTMMAKGIVTAAVLPRASYKDIIVLKGTNPAFLNDTQAPALIATSSTRRRAQWLNRYPNHNIENLRGNVNTRLQKVKDNNWHGAIFAAAGLERINLRPEHAYDLDWMLPAPAQGAIVITCLGDDDFSKSACHKLHDENTAICTTAERDYLRALMGGCTTPISALATIANGQLHFKGNILSLDGKKKKEVSLTVALQDAAGLGQRAADILLQDGGQEILDEVRNAQK
jgi:hydroxymethylbilane synthase